MHALATSPNPPQPSHAVNHVVLPSPPCPSHVVFPHVVLVNAMRDVLPFCRPQMKQRACMYPRGQGREVEKERKEIHAVNTKTKWYVHILLSEMTQTECKPDLQSSFKASSLFLNLLNESMIRPGRGRVGGCPVLTAHVQ